MIVDVILIFQLSSGYAPLGGCKNIFNYFKLKCFSMAVVCCNNSHISVIVQLYFCLIVSVLYSLVTTVQWLLTPVDLCDF